MTTTTASPTVAACPIALFRRRDSPHADRAIRAGRWVPVARGVYAEAAAWRALPAWDRYLARVHATSLRWPDAVFIRESGAALRGLPVFGEPAHVHVAAPPNQTSRPISGARIHTARKLPDFEQIGGLLVATPAELTVDLARSQHHAIGLAVACAVRRRHPEVTVAQLRELNLDRLSTRGRRHALWVFERATGVPESTLEVVSLAAIEWLGFPAPELQRTFVGRSVEDDIRADFWWETTATAGEADGDRKYRDRDAVEVLAERRERDARLQDRGVRATAHWGWFEATNGDPMRAALLAAGLRQEGPEDTAELRSLKRLLAPKKREA